VRLHDAYCRVLQFEWDPVAADDLYPTAFVIHHRVVALGQSRIRAMFYGDAELQTRWSQEIGADLGEPGVLPSLLLRAAVMGNPAGITLFSSKDRLNIEANAAVAKNTLLDAPATHLRAILRRESGIVL
jgi:hypothetical protein